jgi:DUF971 family protein
MQSPDPFPTQVDLVRAENALEITWEDGSRARLDGGRLRWACPCAECHGEMGTPGRLASAGQLPEEELALDEVGLIGQYALQLSFRSGHNTGIYSFHYLKRLSDEAA